MGFFIGWPGWPCYPAVSTPLVYSEDLSVTQQIAHLFGLFQSWKTSLDGYVSKQDFETFLAWLETEEAEQTAHLMGYVNSEIAQLRELVNKLTVSANQWDVQQGRYTDSVTAQRDMFRDLAIYALTVDELANSGQTVETLAESALTVRGLALYSGRFFNGPDYLNPGIIKEME